ncbi:probable Protein AF-9 homolog [Ustilago trichophora]|uniref:Protein AF-9 homolog n=1 Tax=Ustilago trichophora TaxID=86804 RepID=A0A5C3DZ90_9BASI|nr:probable Protein AF-9 homolog [Ustilago trichophora]
MSNKRVRGLSIHRPILYGSTSTPLTPAEKLAAPPDHTHKWTVAVRSAASHPLPSLSAISGAHSNASFEQGSEFAASNTAAGTSGTTTPSTPAAAGSAATISTRGRDQEHDYHKMVGGKDDISHFIKRVQFKLHDTYPQPTRNIDKPPYHVTETGWGEFEIQIKIFFVPEANEKPITLFHHLKLHPWLQQAAAVEAEPPAPSIPAPLPPADTSAAETSTGEAKDEPGGEASTSANDTKPEPGTNSMDADPIPSTTEAGTHTSATATDASAAPAPPKPALPPVVHSWQYDEIVFPEPMEPFYDVLSMHPPSPLPAISALAFTDPAAYRSYQYAQADAAKNKSTATPAPIPPHPLHTPTGYLFDALSIEAQQSEGERLDLARIAAIRELERGRDQLIRAEKALKDARNRIAALNNASVASGSATSAVPPAS